MAKKQSPATGSDASGGGSAPSPAPAPLAYQPASAYKTVWVHHRKVAAVGGRVGYVRVLKTDAAALIAAGHAVDPYTTKLPYITTPAPTPSPSPSPSPAPPAPTGAPEQLQ